MLVSVAAIFSPDMSALPHPDHDDLAAIFHRRLDQIDGRFEFAIQARRHRSNFGQLDFDHFARPRKVIHAAFLERDDGYSILILQPICDPLKAASMSNLGRRLRSPPIKGTRGLCPASGEVSLPDREQPDSTGVAWPVENVRLDSMKKTMKTLMIGLLSVGTVAAQEFVAPVVCSGAVVSRTTC